MVEAEADQKIANRVGAALGFKESGGFNVAGSNSLYGAKSQALSTQEKYLTQGGIDKSVNIDKMESAQKAANQEGSVKGTQEQADKIGKAVGKEVKDVLKDVANAMAQSKVKSDYNTIQGAGGAQNYIKASGDAATEKGASLKAQSDVLRTENDKGMKFIDEDGKITKEGQSALSVSSTEKYFGMMGKKIVGEEGSEKLVTTSGKKAYDQYKNMHAADEGMTAEKLEKGAMEEGVKVMKPYLNKDGSVKTGLDFWQTQAELKAGSFMSSNSMVMGGGAIFSGAFTNGGVSGSLKSGMSAAHDDTAVAKFGNAVKYEATSKDDLHAQWPSKDNESAAKTKQTANIIDSGIDVKGVVKNETARIANDNGSGSENDDGSIAGNIGAFLSDNIKGETIAGTVAAATYTANTMSKGKIGKPVSMDPDKLKQDADFKEKGYYDNEGNKVADPKGNKYDLDGKVSDVKIDESKFEHITKDGYYDKKSGKMIADADKFKVDNSGKRVVSGIVGQVVDNAGKAFKKVSPFNRVGEKETFDSTIDSGTKQANSDIDNKVNHNSSFNNSDTNSITQNEPKSDKKAPIKEEISKEFKNNLENNKEALKNAERIRDNKLAVASTVEAKQKALTEFAQTKAELGGTKINDVKADAFKVEDSAIKEATEKAHKPSGFMKTVTDTFDNIVDGVKNAKTSKKLAVAGATAVTVGAVAGNSTSTTVAREEAKDILTPTDENSGLISAETTSKLVDGGALAFNGLTAKAGMEEMKSGMKSTQFLSDVFIYNIAIL